MDKTLLFYVALLYTGLLSPTQAGRTMMAEPLSPGDFESGRHMEGEVMNGQYDDGTQSDIKLPKEERAKGHVTALWPNGVVPYLLDSSLTWSDRAMIAKSVSAFHAISCVRLVGRRTEGSYVVLKKTAGTYCGSYVGMQGGRQSISLAQRCIDAAGSTIHELMHVLGFQHEQGRMDRDQHVSVFLENIQQGGCVDFDPAYCAAWGRLGHCAKSPVFMGVSCKETCGQCGLGCVDMRRECRDWARRGYCQPFYDYMSLYCAVSCRCCPNRGSAKKE